MVEPTFTTSFMKARLESWSYQKQSTGFPQTWQLVFHPLRPLGFLLDWVLIILDSMIRPHAEAVARLSVPLLTKLFTPSIIPLTSWTKYGISPKQIIRYGGLDPVAWLLPRDSTGLGATSSNFTQCDDGGKNTGILEKLKTDRSKKSILIRLEESKAAYIANKKLVTQPIALVDFVVKHFSEKCNIIILCRYSDQISEISGRYKNKATVLTDVVDGIDMLKNIDIFIGAGGTMTAESALLGRPTISIAPVHFYIDDYLKKTGLIKRAFTASRLVSLVNLFLNDEEQCALLEKKARRMLSEMEDPVDKLVSYIYATALLLPPIPPPPLMRKIIM